VAASFATSKITGGQRQRANEARQGGRPWLGLQRSAATSVDARSSARILTADARGCTQIRVACMGLHHTGNRFALTSTLRWHPFRHAGEGRPHSVMPAHAGIHAFFLSIKDVDDKSKAWVARPPAAWYIPVFANVPPPARATSSIRVHPRASFFIRGENLLAVPPKRRALGSNHPEATRALEPSTCADGDQWLSFCSSALDRSPLRACGDEKHEKTPVPGTRGGDCACRWHRPPIRCAI
jgi:hypothetical protein